MPNFEFSPFVAIAIFLLFGLGDASAECRKSAYSQLDPTIRQQTIEVVAASQAHTPHWNVPRELAQTLNNPLSNYYRQALLEYFGPIRGAVFDVYFADGPSTPTPDTFFLPKDHRLICILAPGAIAKVSDGATFHYLAIGDIDFEAKMVELIDAFATRSFLREGYNLMGVKGIVTKRGDADGLKITFDELVKVTIGVIAGGYFNEFAQAVNAEYSDVNQSDLKFWLVSRMMASGEPQVVRQLGEKLHNTDLDVLYHFAVLYLGTLESSFESGILGRAQTESELRRRRNLYYENLDYYATKLTWPLKWWLASAAIAATDPNLAVDTLRSFLKANEHDVDFRLMLIEALLHTNRASEARDELEKAELFWRRQIASEISTSSEETSIEYFKTVEGRDLQLGLLERQRAKLNILRIKLDLVAGINQHTVIEDIRKASIGFLGRAPDGRSFYIALFQDILETCILAKSADCTEFAIRTPFDSGAYAESDRARLYFSKTLYDTFSALQSIDAANVGTKTLLDLPVIKTPLCTSFGNDEEREKLRYYEKFANFCKWKPNSSADDRRQRRRVGAPAKYRSDTGRRTRK